MNEEDRLRLQANYKKLTEVCYSAISPHLISTFILDMDMHVDIEALPTEKRKMERLIQLLPSRGGRAMKELISALRPSYSWLSGQLQEDTTPDYDAICKNIGSMSTPVNLGQPTSEGDKDNLKDISVAGHLIPIAMVLRSSVMLSTRWTLLASSMQLSPCIIADIRREMSTEGGTFYAISTTLQAWVTKCGPSKATFAQLIKIFKDLEFNDITEGLVDLWTSMQPKSTQ